MGLLGTVFFSTCTFASSLAAVFSAVLSLAQRLKSGCEFEKPFSAWPRWTRRRFVVCWRPGCVLCAPQLCPDGIRARVKSSEFGKRFLEQIPVVQSLKHAAPEQYQRLRRYPGTHGWGGVDFKSEFLYIESRGEAIPNCVASHIFSV